MNPFDTYAIEEGVRLKERFNSGNNGNLDVEVIDVSMGPPQAEGALKESISLGADSGLLLSDRAFAGADRTSKAWRRIGIPFVIAGLAWSYLHHWMIFSIFFLIIPLSLGYGIPDCLLYGGDKGSPIGRFWFFTVFNGI